jgi:alkylation response protein AidB-like acyl-CoA dehydrogenase
MDWRETEDQAAFRAEVRAVIEAKLPQRYKDAAARGGPGERAWEFDRKAPEADRREAAVAWHAALNERGWVAPHWPSEYGGAGLSSVEQFVLNQELARAGAPSVGGSGVSMLGPTLIVHGSEEQRIRYLPPILAGEVTWAQGYSEPGAGSDLAALQTRAVRDGDDFIVSGQKIWTSGAHTADAIFALVRTDPTAPKHRGISFLLIEDIHAPGITVRPLVDLAGNHYFNEVFFEDVRVPAANLVGELNRGWYVGMTLLDFERSNIGSAEGARRQLRKLIETMRSTPELRARLQKPDLRRELADRYIETEVLYQLSYRIMSLQRRGQLPNDEASMSKLYGSELTQRIAATAMRLLGTGANIIEGTASTPFPRHYLGAVPATVRGGTSEVQRNVIATRGLGLPRG